MTRDPLERTDAVIEALRRGRAADLAAPQEGDDGDIAAMRVATLLAMGAGRAPRPSPAFVARLERDLLARQAEAATSRDGAHRTARWPRLGVRMAAAALALSVLLGAALLATRGPAQVLADVRRLLGYVPGLGFVAPQDVRVLAEPVEVTGDGVTARVEGVVAGGRDTRVVLSVVLSGDLPGGEGQTVRAPDAGIVLRAPSGEELPLTAWTQTATGTVLTFGPLPADADSAVLSMRALPGLPVDASHNAWSFLLALRPEGSTDGDMYLVEPYDPAIPARAHHGIALRVMEVAHTADETVVRVAARAEDPEARFPQLSGRYDPTLQDDAGRTYPRRPAPGLGPEAGEAASGTDGHGAAPVAEPTASAGVLAFGPLHPEARELTLEVDGVDAEIPADGEIRVDLGDAPQVGDAFAVNAEVQVAGATVRLTGARLVQEEIPDGEDTRVRTLLQFDAEQVTPRDDVIVHALMVSRGDGAIVRGSSSRGGPDGVYAVGVEFADGWSPGGVLTLSVERAGVVFVGPWRFTWSVPPAARP